MIELIVVLVIIGILIIIWAQWINPKVQLDKAKKVKEEEQVYELLKASLRYYYQYGYYPGITPVSYSEGFEQAQLLTDTDALNVLVEEGEIKESAKEEDLFANEGEVYYIIEPGNCACLDPIGSTYCDNKSSLEGPWLCKYPDDADWEIILDQLEGNEEFVEINPSNQRCAIFDPDQAGKAIAFCAMTEKTAPERNHCWRCLKP